MKGNPFYNLKQVIRYALLIGAFVLACKFTSSLVYPILVPLALYYVSMRKFVQLYFIVLIAISSIVCNGWFMPKPMIFAVAQRGMLVMLGFFLTMMLFGQKNAKAVSPLRAFLWYVLYMVPVSINGWSPLISGLKLFLFFSIFFAMYSSTNGVATKGCEFSQLRGMVLAVASFFLVGSVLLIPFPAIGNMGFDELLNSSVTTVSLFKGMTVHSQTLGPVVAICGVLLFGDLVFSIQRADRLYMVLLALVPFLIVKTSSRTAMGGLLAGMFFVFWCLGRTRQVKRTWKSKLVQGLLMLGAIGSMAVLVIPSTRASVAQFVVKYGDEGGGQLDRETILASRQGKLDSALYGWRQSPIVGNGFQVSEDMRGFKANSISQIMTAPVEKSTWIYAILEEGGVVGEILFCLIAIFIITRLVGNKAYIGASCFFTMLVLNLGEFSMFSLSGVGGFIWGMVFVGSALDAARLQEQQMACGMPMRAYYPGLPPRR